MISVMTLHELLDFHYGADGDALLQKRLAEGDDPNTYLEGETPLHVATRRRRLNAVQILLEHGAHINAENLGGKTAYAHAARRGFHELAKLLAENGARLDLNAADQLAVAIVHNRLDEARKILEADPGCAWAGNPEEDRLLADVAGRDNAEAVSLLIAAGADLTATGLDGGTPLHQAAWFGQPENARLLLQAGAPVDVFDSVHQSSPIGWAVHGSRYSGGAEERQDAYVELVRMLLEAGSSLCYPGDPDDDSYISRLREDATPAVRKVLDAFI